MTLATPLQCTADEFLERDELDGPVELVKGLVQPMPPPSPRHGTICANIAFHLQLFVRSRDLGRVMTNDVCVVTQRDPDTVRGADVAFVSYARAADVAFVSYARAAKGPLPEGYLPAPPDLVVEVRSPDDRWNQLMKKVLEYLDAGVPVVCVIDPTSETARVYRADRDEEQFANGDTLVLEDVLPGFAVPLKQLFE